MCYNLQFHLKSKMRFIFVLLICIELIFADLDIDEEIDDTDYDCNEECELDEVFIPLKLNDPNCQQVFNHADQFNLEGESNCINKQMEFTLKDEDGEYNDVR